MPEFAISVNGNYIGKECKTLFDFSEKSYLLSEMAYCLKRYCFDQRLLAKREGNIDDYMAWHEEGKRYEAASTFFDRRYNIVHNLIENKHKIESRDLPTFDEKARKFLAERKEGWKDKYKWAMMFSSKTEITVVENEIAAIYNGNVEKFDWGTYDALYK